MPKIDSSQIAWREGSGYPSPFSTPVAPRQKQALGLAGGLSELGVNLTRLPPGAWSSQRHWHSHEEEFVYVLSGELVLVSDDGEQTLLAGDCAAFPKGQADGHHLVNRSTEIAVYLEAGTRHDEDVCHYVDVDLHWDPQRGYLHKDGTPYPSKPD